MNKRTDSPSSW